MISLATETQTDPAWSSAAASLYDAGFVLLEDLRPIVPLHPQHIRKLARRGAFPAPIKIGGRTAFRRADIRRWVEAQG